MGGKKDAKTEFEKGWIMRWWVDDCDYKVHMLAGSKIVSEELTLYDDLLIDTQVCQSFPICFWVFSFALG